MKIALVHDFLNQWGGAERVLKTFTEIFPDAPIFVLTKDQAIVEEFFPGKIITTSFIQDLPGMPKTRKIYFPLMPKAIESFDFSGFDVVLSSASAYAKGIITKPPTKHICYLHTPTRYLTSDKEEYLTSAPIPFPLIGRPIVRSLVKSITEWDLQASKRPDYLIANSQNIAERTVKYYGRTPEQVIFPPVDTKKFTISSDNGDYWLVLGRNEPYKRTDLAVKAANELGIKLKVVGGGSELDKLKQIAGSTVEFTGRVSEAELTQLYSNSIGLIHPQPREDAGMTALEAMASGRPVVAFRDGGVIESIKEGVTGEFFDELTVESLVNTLKQFNKQKYDPKKIREHVMQFDIEIFKEKITQAVNSQLS